MRAAFAGVWVTIALACALPATASAQGDPAACAGNLQADQVAPAPGAHPLRFGITPGVQTGQLGSGAAPPRLPEDPAKTLDALGRLKPPGAPLVLRLHRFFWSDGEDGVKRFLALKNSYTSHGYLVELQLRYHPSPAQEGDIAAWTKHVRDVVDRFGADPRVVAIQVTNEVNLTFSPDSSDGSYKGAKDALIQGVIAAQDEKRRRGYDQLEIGFNWAYRSTPDEEKSFWEYLRDHGGPAFVGSLDWIALDAYPGTFFPPVNTPGGERDALINALSTLRDCYAPVAGIPPSVPLHIEENGFPTSEPERSYARQAQIAENMIRLFHDYSANYNIADYRWFDLRDADSTSSNFQQQYGLMRDDYTPKPAFDVVAGLARELSIQPSGPDGRAGTRIRCGRRKTSFTALPRSARSADFFLDGRLVARDAHPPLVASVPARRIGARRHRITVRVVRFDGGGGRRILAFRCRRRSS
ncbi:MAG: hypothetical protein QOJ07_2083 [Thermoleophilaceae bacterium]|nr:hypothetical protein [Thermoleophilaceae bacterium]